jgi:hypothetical protein
VSELISRHRGRIGSKGQALTQPSPNGRGLEDVLPTALEDVLPTDLYLEILATNITLPVF